MKYVVCYDVGDDGRRSRVANVLLNYGSRVQESVFVAEVSEALKEEMREKTERLIDRVVDKVHIFPLCAGCEGKIVELGSATLPVEQEYYVV